MPFPVVLFGVLGGLNAFGAVGLFLGPVILAVLLSVWQAWLKLQQKEHSSDKESPHAWHTLSAEEVIHSLASDHDIGLSQIEAAERLNRYGSNRLSRKAATLRLAFIVIPVQELSYSGADCSGYFSGHYWRCKRRYCDSGGGHH